MVLHLLCRFEGRLKKLRWWLEHMEKRMTTDLLEANQRGPEKAVLEQVEEYQQEVLKERSLEKLLRNKSSHLRLFRAKRQSPLCNLLLHCTSSRAGILSSGYARRDRH